MNTKNLYKLTIEERKSILNDLCLSTPDILDYIINSLNDGLKMETHVSFHPFWTEVKNKIESIRSLYNQ